LIVLAPDFRARLDGRDRFDDLMAIEGELFKAMPGRKTQRFVRGGKSYFIKTHYGVGWKEIAKNLFRLRLPVLGARNEYRAIERLHALGVPTMRATGFGARGINPARRRSFLITEALDDTITLEDLCREWKAKPPGPGFKRRLIERVAATARRLHENGVNHRDFYLCHLRLQLRQPGELYVMDLHRAQLRSRTPRRWKIKDLAALHFSSMDAGLTTRDLYRFIKAYRGKPLKQIFPREQRFWSDVHKKALKLYRR
jgi:heptose I phosphotransferase